ncbi:unnamed protein product, partial [Meganyctiphanes norvegica]
METLDKKIFDLVVYGATGYTGQYVVEEVGRVAAAEVTAGHEPLTWAIAGRNRDKLSKALQVARDITGLPLTDVGIIIANSDDDDSLQKMASQAKIIINVVGPYQKYGPQVVKACIENGTSHVDISGEPQFSKFVRLIHNRKPKLTVNHLRDATGLNYSEEEEIGHTSNKLIGSLNFVLECYYTTKTEGGPT